MFSVVKCNFQTFIKSVFFEGHISYTPAIFVEKLKLEVLMEILKLPPEILENIFLHLDTQALGACALADPRLADIVYSSHFLDEYCRASLSCTWVTAADVCNMCIVVPYEFWFWVYTTMKLEDTGQANVIFHNKYLTKIGTFRHMFIMWLVCGLRPSFLYSHTLMYQRYPLPETVSEVFELIEQPVPDIIDTLLKIFIGLPEIMKLTCSSLILFKMQGGGSTSLYMDIVCNDGIEPKLPVGFSCMFSIEIILTAMFGKHPSLLILIGKDRWVLWLGCLIISFDHNEVSIADNLFCRYFSNEEKISEIRYQAQHAILDLSGYVYSLRDAAPCPIISGDHSDMAALTISLAQEHHRGLQQKFDLVLDRYCSQLVSTVTQKDYIRGHNKDIIIECFNFKISQNLQINDYVFRLLKCDMNKIKHSSFENWSYMMYKCILERIACLFRTEIHFCVENSFCHSFLCGCLGPTYTARDSEYVEDKIEKCLSEKMKDGLYSPHMWPSHVLSAACQIVPILTEILEADIQMITSRSTKFVIPRSVQQQTNQKLRNAGMILTNRPPSKPRCPPLLKQVRFWSMESLI